MKAQNLHWQCIKSCGACCRLAPHERVEALEVLTEDQGRQYLEMVRPDGWCRHFDHTRRICTIYEERPDFCRVKTLAHLFNVPLEDGELFAIKCCRQQIRSVYGGRSKELKKFEISLRKPVKTDG